MDINAEVGIAKYIGTIFCRKNCQFFQACAFFGPLHGQTVPIGFERETIDIHMCLQRGDFKNFDFWKNGVHL